MDAVTYVPGAAVPLESVLCTEELQRRPSRPPDYQAENQALRALAQELTNSPDGVLQRLVDIALALCQGHSAGISLLEEGPPGHLSPQGDHFRWHAVAGQWASRIWQTTTPRDYGPCGTVLDRNCTLLFAHAHRYYTQFAAVEPLLVEGLLVPFHVNGQAVGTVWVVTHDDRRKFDAEDRRLLESLATFAATAYQTRLALSAQAQANQDLHAEIAERQRAEAVLRQREEELTDFFENSAMGLHWVSADGTILRVNQAELDLLGYTRDEYVGHHIAEFHADQDVIDDILRRLTRGETLHNYEARLRCKDGALKHVLINSNVLWGKHGEFRHTRCFTRDVTDRKHATEALRDLNASLAQRVAERTALLALMHDLTSVANTAPTLEHALLVAVERICAATGWPVGHAYLPASDGTGLWMPAPLWHLADAPRWTAFQQAAHAGPLAPGESLIGRAIATGAPAWSGDLRTDLAPRRQHTAVQSGLATGCAVPLLVEQEVVGILAFYAEARQAPDTTLLDALLQIGTQLGRAVERARAADQALRQQEALFQREKLAAMSTLLASVAHELNNPLASILLQSELLREDLRESPLAAPITEITQAAARCERLVRQFLTLARQHPPERAAVALNTLVAETVELLAYPFRVDNVAVHLHLDEQLPLLWGDPHQLQQVLLNLLTNAQQALRAAPGTREITCTTRYDAGQHRIALAVADTGPGIPLPLQGRIFEPFFTTKPPGVGTGLGLPLCRGIVEAHGGTLEVASTLGAGATFRLSLPAGTVPAVPPAPPRAGEGAPARAQTILLVEDEQSLANPLARLLRRDGHTVETAANGRLALAKLDERAYDLLLCDVRMPELDGPSLYRLLERQWPHLCARCIFLTGDTLEPATQAFLEQSGVPCLTKPFSSAEVRRAVRRVLDEG